MSYIICTCYEKEASLKPPKNKNKNKIIVKENTCVICDKILCDYCTKIIKTKIKIGNLKAKNKIILYDYYNYTICFLCLNKFILQTKNFDINIFYNIIQELYYNNNYKNPIHKNKCNSCLNFNFNKNFKIYFNINYNVMSQQFYLFNNKKESCFDKNCFYCFLNFLNCLKINKYNKKYLQIILLKLSNIIKNSDDSIYNKGLYNKGLYNNNKIILDILEENQYNIPKSLIIVNKINPYDEIYKKEFYNNFTQTKKDKINSVLKNIQAKNNLFLTEKLITYNLRPSFLKINKNIDKNYIKYILEYIENKNINIDDYKFYYYYNLINENIKNYFLDKNNFKHVDNLDLYNKIYTFDEFKTFKKSIRNVLETKKYKYAITFDITDPFLNIIISKEFNNFLKKYILDNNIRKKILKYFKKINIIRNLLNLPSSPISPYIFKLFIHNTLNTKYIKIKPFDIPSMHILCNNIIFFGDDLNILLKNTECITIYLQNFNFKINIDRIKFFNLKYQNLFFLNTYLNSSIILKKIIQKWKENTYKPGSKFYYNLEKEFNKKINILNKEKENF